MRIDLHTHSTASDGTQPPAEVIVSAARAGLDVVALTDHDTTAGWLAASVAAQQHGVHLVRGTEFSCRVNGVGVHLLGYCFDPTFQHLREAMDHSRSRRVDRAQQIVHVLAPSTGLTWSDVVIQVQEDGPIGRPHIADALVSLGVVPDREAAFAQYLSERHIAGINSQHRDAATLIRWIRDAGGVSVLAHPRAAREPVIDDEAISGLTEAGLAGIEVQHRDHDLDAQAALAFLAARLDLVATGSSDYHGSGKPNRLGENTTHPDAFAELMSRVGETQTSAQ
ncbi:MAG: PHP domain-containing protein [Actinomycetota bacterium]